jgi:hypothetical protein
MRRLDALLWPSWLQGEEGTYLSSKEKVCNFSSCGTKQMPMKDNLHMSIYVRKHDPANQSNNLYNISQKASYQNCTELGRAGAQECALKVRDMPICSRIRLLVPQCFSLPGKDPMPLQTAGSLHKPVNMGKN